LKFGINEAQTQPYSILFLALQTGNAVMMQDSEVESKTSNVLKTYALEN
jgi:hypothetical protein